MYPAGQVYILVSNKTDVFTIWDLADIHEGNIGCVRHKFMAQVRDIRDDPHAFWIGGGDWAESITINDPRYQPDADGLTAKERNNPILAQKRRLIAMADPIKEKGIGFGTGNHEFQYSLRSGGGLAEEIAEGLGLPYFGYSFFVDVIFIRTSSKLPRDRIYRTRPVNGGSATRVRIMAHHGSSAATTEGGRINALVKLAKRHQADVVFTSHLHNLLSVPIGVMGVDSKCRHLKASYKWGIMTGSFLQSYHEGTDASYAERKGYDLAFLGAAGIQINPWLRQMKPAMPWMDF